MERKTAAILVAAGNSTRMRSKISKQFLPLLGKPALYYTLSAFESCPLIGEIIVVSREQDRPAVRKLAENGGFSKVTAVVSGGASRGESVRNGVMAVSDSIEFFAVHDGARPMVKPEEIANVLLAAFETKAAALGVPVKDTIKMVDEHGCVVHTPERSALRAVQTPQVFERALYMQALEKARRDGREYTDDCQLIEQAGGKVTIVNGSEENIKLTTPQDILLAECILKSRRQEETALRVGHGYDVHKFAPNRNLILGGVKIPHTEGLLGHSDADVLLHAIMDALLGAAALGDIGKLFPDTDPAFLNADSLKLLAKTAEALLEQGYRIVNIDSTVVAQAPRLKAYIGKMRENIAFACGVNADCVSVKATTEEGLGFTGNREGISAHAVCLIEK